MGGLSGVRAIATILVFLLGAAACGGSDPQRPLELEVASQAESGHDHDHQDDDHHGPLLERPTDPLTTGYLRLTDLRGIGELGVVEDRETLIESARAAGLDERQTAALLDNSVSFAEHNQLVALTMDCLREAGLEVLDGGVHVDGVSAVPRAVYSFAAGNEVVSEDEALALDVQCSNRFHTVATDVYLASQSPTFEEQSERLATLLEEFRLCLNAAGFDVAGQDEITAEYIGTILSYAGAAGHSCETPL